MPYTKNEDLPDSVRNSLPDSAQTIYRMAFNASIKEHPDYSEEKLAKIAWGAVKKVYHKSGDKWVRAELFGAESLPESYDSATHIVKAIKVGTVAHNPLGIPFECTADWFEVHAADWTGGHLIANHDGDSSETFGDLIRSWWEDPFVMMELGNMDAEAENRMLANEHTGFSFDAVGFPDDPDGIVGTNLSILFFPHRPACPSTEGCGLASESQSQNVINKDKTNNGVEAMVEEKTYTSAEIESIRAEAAASAARLATLESEASTHGSEVDALKAEIKERSDKISELMANAETLFSAEDVEAKVTEVKGAMFSAEDVEAAKTKAIEDAIAAEKIKMDRIAAEIDAVAKMYPDGLDTEFKDKMFAMIKEGKPHEVLVELGNGIEYKALKASIPANVEHAATEPPETNGFTVGACKGV